jgi:hypothetical protein
MFSAGGGGNLMLLQDTWMGAVIAAAAVFGITWIFAFIMRFFSAGADLYYAEKERADRLEGRLTPRILVFLDSGGIRRVQTQLVSSGQKGPDEKWIQVTVRSDTPMSNCEVRLILAERVAENVVTPILMEPVFCVWSNIGTSSIDIPALVPYSANLFSIADVSSPTLEVQTLPVKFEFKDEIQKPGTYRLQIAASATGFPTEKITLLLNWNGAYEDIAIRPE